ncbi:MAG: hypothetical protein ACM3PY_02725 [Omnitrophica WOR_2 bacterium]
MDRTALKSLLGELPLTAEVYWYLRQPGKPLTENFSLSRLEKHLVRWLPQVELYRNAQMSGMDERRILLFGTLRYWIEHTTLVGMALAALGHRVSLAYLPYAHWRTPINRFDLRRQDAYTRSVLNRAASALQVIPLLQVKNRAALPEDLARTIEENAWRDTQYTLQVEEVDPDSELYRLRLDRDRQAAASALSLLKVQQPEVVLIPNGSILEFSAFYQAARSLKIPVVTYEFGEQRQRIWLARDADVMRQETDALWKARGSSSLTPDQSRQVRDLFAARQHGNLWANFSRRWQGVAGEGGEKARLALNLDSPSNVQPRPVVLLATNVIGDSLTLGRQVFSDSMTEWLERTLRYFASRSDVQFVVRIHPGELITKGPSVADLVRRVLPERPAHIHLVEAGDKVNTYDIVEIADLGLVYTTTVGMEMAMSGVPVVVVGRTHYRGKGFTLDPDTWEAYFALLDDVLSAPERYRMAPAQVDCAWNYAYRFFFEYPQPFPWHLLRLWDDVKEWPLERVLSPEGLTRFANTFRYLAGEPVDWSKGL